MELELYDSEAHKYDYLKLYNSPNLGLESITWSRG